MMANPGTQSIDRARLAWNRSPLPRFLRWWGAELAALLPVRVREWLQRGPDVLWLGVEDGAATIRRARTGAALARIEDGLPEDVQRAVFAEACQGIDPDDRRLLLVVPASQVLVRRLVLPAAAAADPRRVAGYEIDRQTPFTAAEAYYDVHPAPDPAPPGQVALDLVVAPRSAIDPRLERIALLGAAPDGIDVETAAGALAGIDLLPPARRAHRVDKRRRVNWILAAAAVLLVVLALSQWLDNRRAALATMQAEVDAMRARATQSEQLRAQLEGSVAASKFLVERKSQAPSALAVLDDLTRSMPASAWLTALTLDETGGLDITGEAAKAAGLVDTLAGSGVLESPRLQGVIQPDSATGKERFELVARIRGYGAAHGQ